MKKILLVLSFLMLTILFTPLGQKAFASNTSSSTNCTPTDLGCIPNDPVGFVQHFYGIGLSILGGVALLFLIIGGFTILSSQGSPEKVQRGKEYIYFSIAGLLLAFFSFLFVQFIASSVLQIPGFS